MKGKMFILIILILMPFAVIAAQKQEQQVPIQLRVAIYFKIFKYERTLNKRSKSGINIAFFMTNKKKANRNIKANLIKAIKTIGIKKLNGLTVNIVDEDITNLVQLKKAIKEKGITHLYIIAKQGDKIDSVAEICRDNSILTVMGVQGIKFVSEGKVDIGLTVEKNKTRIVLNLNLLKKEGIQFPAAFLRLTKIVK